MSQSDSHTLLCAHTLRPSSFINSGRDTSLLRAGNGNEHNVTGTGLVGVCQRRLLRKNAMRWQMTQFIAKMCVKFCVVHSSLAVAAFSFPPQHVHGHDTKRYQFIHICENFPHLFLRRRRLLTARRRASVQTSTMSS